MQRKVLYSLEAIPGIDTQVYTLTDSQANTARGIQKKATTSAHHTYTDYR